MAKQGRIQRNERLKSVVSAQKAKRLGLKAKKKELTISYNKLLQSGTANAAEVIQKATKELLQVSFAFQKIKRDGSAVRIRNRCSLTGRPRGYLRLFGLSRVTAREVLSYGLGSGFKKASW